MRALVLVLLAACGGEVARRDATPDPADATYSAHTIIGGLDRIVIAKRTDTTCFGLVLRSPGGNEPDLMLPPNWQRESSYARQPATACDPPFDTPTNMFETTAQLGTIGWQGNTLPSSITSIDVTLTFDTPPLWCPPQVRLLAENIPVN